MKEQYRAGPTGSSNADASFSDVDELSRKVFERLPRNHEDAAAEDPLGYLLRMAAGVARELHGPEGLSSADWLSEILIGQLRGENSDVAARVVDHERVHAAVEELPRAQSAALQLHIEGLTCAQIAQRQGITYQAALHDLTSAYTRLRFQLDPINGSEPDMPDGPNEFGPTVRRP